MNGGGATNGGLYVKDVTAPNTNTGSLLWDSTNDYWKAGTSGSEEEILLRNSHGVVSGSSQITITESQISDLTHYTDSDNTDHLNSLGVISGSSQVDYSSILNKPTIPTNNSELTNGAGYLNSLPAGVISGSAQITAVTETRVGSTLSFWQGTQAQYDTLGSYDSNTIYLVE